MCKQDMCICMYIYIHMHTYIALYMCVCVCVHVFPRMARLSHELEGPSMGKRVVITRVAMVDLKTLVTPKTIPSLDRPPETV